jgi:hypothetical protein
MHVVLIDLRFESVNDSLSEYMICFARRYLKLNGD